MVKVGETPLILFKNKDKHDTLCNSFAPLIEYAKNNLVDKNKKVIEEKHIIGTTIKDIKNRDKQI